MTHLGKALSDLKATVEIPVDSPLLGFQVGRQDVQRFFYWNVLKSYWNSSLDWESNVTTNFDWYHPLHVHRHAGEEFRL